MFEDHKPKRVRVNAEAQARRQAMAEAIGREIRVFPTFSSSSSVASVSNTEETDAFFELTAEDFARIQSAKKEDKHLKTRKIREAEAAARRSKITKSMIRFRFPDDLTMEAKFHCSETVGDLVELLKKILARPEIPFYMYTTPPKKPLTKMSMDLYDAGFVPGAIVHFSYNHSKVDDPSCLENSGPFLREDILVLNDANLAAPQQAIPTEEVTPEAAVETPSPNNAVTRPEVKKTVKPKWFKR